MWWRIYFAILILIIEHFSAVIELVNILATIKSIINSIMIMNRGIILNHNPMYVMQY